MQLQDGWTGLTAWGAACAEKQPDRGAFWGGYILRDLQIVIGAIHPAGAGLWRRYRDDLVTLLPHGGFHPAQMKVTRLALPFGIAGYLATLNKRSRRVPQLLQR